MRIVIKLLIAALLIHAGVQAGRSGWRYYTLKDAIAQEVSLGPLRTPEQVRQLTIDLAAARGITLDGADVSVRREGTATTVAAVYEEDIDLIPRLYTHRWTYTPSVTATRGRPLAADDLK